MNAISLFSGVGMFDLGVSLAGFNIVAQVEIDDYCRKVIKRHEPSYWPDSKQFTDVCQFGRDSITGAVDLIFGGFPCQPHSTAGSRKGETDSRNLWPEFKRIIGEIRPGAVMLENVPGITQAYPVENELRPAYALTVIADLAAMGYVSQWGTISASDCGAPHNRARWWCVAYAQHDGHIASPQPGRDAEAVHQRKARTQCPRKFTRGHSPGTVPRELMGNTQKARLPIRQQARRLQNQAQARKRLGINRPKRSVKRSAQSRMGRATHGLAPRLDGLRWPARPNVHQHDWEAPRTVPPREIDNRTARIKSLGNGGIWHIAYTLAQEIKNRIGATP